MANPLEELEKRHDFFVGIDSDGCAFDSMEIKHKECFCPAFVKYFSLQAVSKYAREAWEFVNLYSKSRGANRYLAVLEALDLLGRRKEVKGRGVTVPPLSGLRDWVKRETRLATGTLKAEVSRTSDPDLALTLRWSDAVNAAIEDIVSGVPPFPLVRESLEKSRGKADLIVVSQTPTEALEREWKEHRIDGLVSYIAGQELGSKAEHLKMAAGGKYGKDHILMIGDAPGDHKAAKAVDALFFPILPGKEEESWERFHREGIDRFLSMRFAGSYQKSLLEDFDASLPSEPRWK